MKNLFQKDINNILTFLNKEQKNDFLEKIKNNNLFYKYVVSGMDEKLVQLLEQGLPTIKFSYSVTDMQSETIDDYCYKIEKIINKLDISKIKLSTMDILLNYCFHQDSLFIFRKVFFQTNKNEILFEKYFNMFNENLSYLKFEKQSLLQAILNNKNDNIYQKYLLIEKSLNYDFFFKRGKIKDFERYKKYFYYLQKNTDQLLSFEDYSIIYQKNVYSEKVRNFICDECQKQFDLKSPLYAKILFICDECKLEKKHDECSNFLLSYRQKMLKEKQLLLYQTINKASGLESIERFIEFLKINDVPKNFYEHLLVKLQLEQSVDSGLSVNMKNNYKI